MTPSLLVVRVKDLAENCEFYSRLGFSFVEEKHGNGPTHFSSSIGGMVLELYPCKESEGPSNIRLGFRFQKADKSIAHARKLVEENFDSKYIDGDGYEVYVVVDPDKRKVEIGFEM